MGTRLLVSILLTMVLVASPPLPVRAQPAGPSAPAADQAQPLPAPPVPPQAPNIGPIPVIPQVPTLAPRPLTLSAAIAAGLQNNFQTRVAPLGRGISREQPRNAVAPRTGTG